MRGALLVWWFVSHFPRAVIICIYIYRRQPNFGQHTNQTKKKVASFHFGLDLQRTEQHVKCECFFFNLYDNKVYWTHFLFTTHVSVYGERIWELNPFLMILVIQLLLMFLTYLILQQNCLFFHIQLKNINDLDKKTRNLILTVYPSNNVLKGEQLNTQIFVWNTIFLGFAGFFAPTLPYRKMCVNVNRKIKLFKKNVKTTNAPIASTQRKPKPTTCCFARDAHSRKTTHNR